MRQLALSRRTDKSWGLSACAHALVGISGPPPLPPSCRSCGGMYGIIFLYSSVRTPLAVLVKGGVLSDTAVITTTTMIQVKEGTLTEVEALLRIPANQMDFFLHPTLDPKADKVEGACSS